MIAGPVLALILTFSFFAAAQGKSTSWKGWVSDTHCGAKGMTAEHKDCAKTCVKGMGAKYVFVNSENKQMIPIHNQDAVKETDPARSDCDGSDDERQVPPRRAH